jgi:hypothetical protein
MPRSQKSLVVLFGAALCFFIGQMLSGTRNPACIYFLNSSHEIHTHVPLKATTRLRWLFSYHEIPPTPAFSNDHQIDRPLQLWFLAKRPRHQLSHNYEYKNRLREWKKFNLGWRIDESSQIPEIQFCIQPIPGQKATDTSRRRLYIRISRS